jgi:CHASE2 domain-containing sensor protein
MVSSGGSGRRRSATSARSVATRWLASPFGHAGMSLMLAFGLIAGKIVLEHSRVGMQIEQATLNLLQLRLLDAVKGGSGPLAVQVIDISEIPLVGRTGPSDPLRVTDREALRRLVLQVALREPAAIGLDVLLDPPPGGVLTAAERDLLETCLALRNGKGEQLVAVAIHDGIARGPAEWLGADRFARLATTVVVPRPTDLLSVARLPRALTLPLTPPVVIDSMALRLAERKSGSNQRDGGLGAWLAAAFPRAVVRERQAADTPLDASEYLVDYSALPRLVAETVRAEQTGRVDLPDIAGRVVLIGRASGAVDTFVVSNQPEPMPGVYVHAAGTQTLVDGSLFALTPAGRVWADVIVAVLPIGTVLLVRLRRRGRRRPSNESDRLPDRLTLMSAAGVWLFGYAWVVSTGILWTDFVMVVGALLIHGPLERLMLSRLHS